VIAHIASGDLRALGVASPRRAARLPEVPTLQEAGVAGVEADAWFALFAPAKTPPAAIERLYNAVAAALRKEGPQKALASQGMTVTIKSPAEMSALLPDEVQKWAGVIKAANITIE
jgi:tripartite-type tricarboxylate transporter receptor subunit TctC